MAKAFSYSTSTSTSQSSSSIGSPTTGLIAASASGDDRNLATHGSDPRYWYSISDGHRLALDIRQKILSSTYVPDDPTRCPVS